MTPGNDWHGWARTRGTSPDPAVRRSAATALGQFGSMYPSAAVPALQKALQDSDAKVRKAAVTALKRSGPEALRRLVSMSVPGQLDAGAPDDAGVK